jgi:hypothetical protein
LDLKNELSLKRLEQNFGYRKSLGRGREWHGAHCVMGRTQRKDSAAQPVQTWKQSQSVPKSWAAQEGGSSRKDEGAGRCRDGLWTATVCAGTGLSVREIRTTMNWCKALGPQNKEKINTALRMKYIQVAPSQETFLME